MQTQTSDEIYNERPSAELIAEIEADDLATYERMMGLFYGAQTSAALWQLGRAYAPTIAALPDYMVRGLRGYFASRASALKRNAEFAVLRRQAGRITMAADRELAAVVASAAA